MPPLQSAFAAARGEGALARRQITQFIIRRCTKGVENGPALSALVLLPLTAGLDPFETMTVAATAAKYFGHRQGRGALGEENLAIVIVLDL